MNQILSRQAAPGSRSLLPANLARCEQMAGGWRQVERCPTPTPILLLAAQAIRRGCVPDGSQAKPSGLVPSDVGPGIFAARVKRDG